MWGPVLESGAKVVDLDSVFFVRGVPRLPSSNIRKSLGMLGIPQGLEMVQWVAPSMPSPSIVPQAIDVSNNMVKALQDQWQAELACDFANARIGRIVRGIMDEDTLAEAMADGIVVPGFASLFPSLACRRCIGNKYTFRASTVEDMAEPF